jgi:hypothetical protein
VKIERSRPSPKTFTKCARSAIASLPKKSPKPDTVSLQKLPQKNDTASPQKRPKTRYGLSPKTPQNPIALPYKNIPNSKTMELPMPNQRSRSVRAAQSRFPLSNQRWRYPSPKTASPPKTPQRTVSPKNESLTKILIAVIMIIA